MHGGDAWQVCMAGMHGGYAWQVCIGDTLHEAGPVTWARDSWPDCLRADCMARDKGWWVMTGGRA